MSNQTSHQNPQPSCSLKYTIEINRYYIDDKDQVFINPAWLDIQVKEMWDDPIFEKVREQIDISFVQVEENRGKIIFPGYDLKSQIKFSLFLYLYEHRFSIFLEKNEIKVDEIVPEMFERYLPDYNYYCYEFEGYFPYFFTNLFDSVLSEDITTTYQDNIEEQIDNFVDNTEDYPKVTNQEPLKSPEVFSGLRDIGVLFEPDNGFIWTEIEIEFLAEVIEETTVRVDDYILQVLDTIANKTIEEFEEEFGENNQNVEKREEKLEEMFINNILKRKELILDHHYSFPGRERPESDENNEGNKKEVVNEE